MADPFNDDAKPTTDSKPVTEAPPPKAKGADLRPDLSVVHGDQAAGPFWYGALGTLPVGSVTIAGITFMQVVEDVSYDEAEQETKRSPYIGVVGRLMKSQLRALMEELPRMVVRFHGVPDEEPDGANVSDISGRKKKDERRGFIVRIPSPEEERKLRESGKFRPFIPSRFDEPLADHIYLIQQDARSQHFPAPLGETGLEV